MDKSNRVEDLLDQFHKTTDPASLDAIEDKILRLRALERTD